MSEIDDLSGRSELPSDKDNLDRFLESWFSPDAIATREAVRNQIAGSR